MLEYSVIVADPPWRYSNGATRNAAKKKYETMSQGSLLKISPPVAPNAHLYLWTTNLFLADGLALVRAWGFEYKTMLTWCKPQMGMGNYFRVSTEHVLFGVRGRLPPLRRNCPTWFVAPRTQHSEKPDSFYDLVESMSPGPRYEMFCRRARFGWDNDLGVRYAD